MCIIKKMVLLTTRQQLEEQGEKGTQKEFGPCDVTMSGQRKNQCVQPGAPPEVEEDHSRDANVALSPRSASHSWDSLGSTDPLKPWISLEKAYFITNNIHRELDHCARKHVVCAAG